MNFICTKCGTEIKSENVNISTDLAKCQNCGTILKASKLANSLEKTDFNPPFGASIIVRKGYKNELELELPKKGFTASSIPQLLFAIFWLSFITFWTWGASQGSVIFALFSIPFWLIGIAMIVGLINSANERQIIKVDKYKLSIEKIRPIKSMFFEIENDKVVSIKMKNMELNQFSAFKNPSMMFKMRGSFGNSIEYPAIITGIKTQYFFENANDAEQEWIVKLVDKIVNQNKR